MSTTDPDLRTRIARLFVHPVKSCAGIELPEALLVETGLDLDRAWMVVDAAGRFVTQRELPRLALVRPQFRRLEVVRGWQWLRVRAGPPGGEVERWAVRPTEAVVATTGAWTACPRWSCRIHRSHTGFRHPRPDGHAARRRLRS